METLGHTGPSESHSVHVVAPSGVCTVYVVRSGEYRHPMNNQATLNTGTLSVLVRASRSAGYLQAVHGELCGRRSQWQLRSNDHVPEEATRNAKVRTGFASVHRNQ